MNNDRTRTAIELLVADILDRRFVGRVLLLEPHSCPPHGCITRQMLQGEANAILRHLENIDREFGNWSVEVEAITGKPSAPRLMAIREAKP